MQLDPVGVPPPASVTVAVFDAMNSLITTALLAAATGERPEPNASAAAARRPTAHAAAKDRSRATRRGYP